MQVILLEVPELVGLTDQEFNSLLGLGLGFGLALVRTQNHKEHIILEHVFIIELEEVVEQGLLLLPIAEDVLRELRLELLELLMELLEAFQYLFYPVSVLPELTLI